LPLTGIILLSGTRVRFSPHRCEQKEDRPSKRVLPPLFYLLFIYLFICNSPTDHTVMTEITSVKTAGQQGSELR